MNARRHQQRQQRLKEKVDSRIDAETERRGSVIVFTGNGKGKTTAGFGTVTRVPLSWVTRRGGAVSGLTASAGCWSRTA